MYSYGAAIGVCHCFSKPQVRSVMRNWTWALSSAAFNAAIVFGAGTIAVAQNALREPSIERSAPVPLSALQSVPTALAAHTAVASEPQPVPVTGSLTAAAEPAGIQSQNAGVAPKAASIDPIVEPIKREQPTVASVKAATKSKTVAVKSASSFTTMETKPAKSGTAKPATKVAAWKQKADSPVKKKVAAKAAKVRTARAN
jgi:hypothetical protein